MGLGPEEMTPIENDVNPSRTNIGNRKGCSYMEDSTSEVKTEQIAIWRNLLDAFGQLSSAWDTAVEAQRQAPQGQGPGAGTLPDDLVAAFTLAATRGSEALTGIAEMLAAQSSNEEIEATVQAQRAASQHWEAARADS